MSVEVTKIQNYPKKKYLPKKAKICQKKYNISKNGLLCSLRGLCDLHGLFGHIDLSHSVKKQGQKQVIGGTKIGPR
jgi:hypothetical protein